MRLLQVSLRGSIVFSVILVLVSIPVSLFTIRELLNEEVDKSIAAQADQFIRQIRTFEYLEDLETDLTVLDKLSANIHIQPATGSIKSRFSTLNIYDSLDHKTKPYRRYETSVLVKNKPYHLVVRMSLVENNALILAIGLVEVAVSVLLVTGLLFLNRSLSRKLWQPFYKTLDTLKAYELDKNERVVTEPSNIVEFNDLNKAVSHLIARNRETFLQQKEFIENASHELQTPIAIFQSKLDSLMQSPGLNQQDADIILELESTIKRMSRLNRNLLLLGKLDNDQFPEKETIDLSSLVNSQSEVFHAMAGTANLSVQMRLETVYIHANRTLVEILITNLFHNAIRHSIKGTQVVITTTQRGLTFTNQGDPQPVDLDKMVKRFKKHSRDPESTGLGLAIVRKIADVSGFSLNYSFNNSLHTFTIAF